MVSLKQPCNQITKSLLCPQHTQYNGLLEDPYDVTLFAVCLLGFDELWVYDQIYVFIRESYLSLFDILYAWLFIASYLFFESLV